MCRKRQQLRERRGLAGTGAGPARSALCVKSLPAGFDPHWHWQRLRWRNRWAEWRRRPGESLFHALGSSVLLGLLLWLLLDAAKRLAEPVQLLLQTWPWLSAIAALLPLAQRQRRNAGAWAALRASDWLAAQPVSASIRRASRRRRIAAEAALQLFAGFALLSLLGQSATTMLAYVGLVMLAAALGTASATRPASMAAGAGLVRQPSGPGRGRLWRWQWIEAGAARFGPGLAPGAFALLLMPVGGSLLLAAALLLAGLVISALATAWRRSLGVIPRAQTLLACQPMRGLHWLQQTAPLPLAVVVLSALLLFAASRVLGLGGFAWAAAAGLVALGALQLLCVVAERSRPQRAALLFVLLATTLLATLQALPPLVPVLWLGMLAWLLRRVLRA